MMSIKLKDFQAFSESGKLPKPATFDSTSIPNQLKRT